MNRRPCFFEALTAIEIVLYFLASGALVLVGPGIWFYRLMTTDQVPAAIIVAISWLASVVVVVREARRGTIAALSLGIFLTWLVVLVYVFREVLI